MDLEKMENSELLTYFLISRDNLVSIRRAMFENKNESLQVLFDEEQKQYDTYLKEVFRRMHYGTKNKR